MKTKLSANFIKNMPTPTKKQVYRDTDVTGFGVEVRSSGEATYWLYAQIDGRLRQLRIGRVQDLSFDQTKKEAKRLRSEITLGRDPAVAKEERRAVPLYGELAEQHLADAKLHQKSYDTTEMYMRRHIPSSVAQKQGL